MTQHDDLIDIAMSYKKNSREAAMFAMLSVLLVDIRTELQAIRSILEEK